MAGFAGKDEGTGTILKNCYAAEVTINTSEAVNADAVTADVGGFMKKNGKSPSITNCYTTLAGNSNDYVATISDKAAIVAGLVTNLADTKYATSSEINNGYPYIKAFVQDATPTPVPTQAPTVAPTTAPTATPGNEPTATPVATSTPAPTPTATPDEIVAATSLTGNGTEIMPYIISNASELKKANEMINSAVAYSEAYYKVTADIDYQNNEWVPLGRPHNNGFAGTFDGGNHVIKNVKVTNFGGQNAINGFFASANDTTVIKDLGLENITIQLYTNQQTAYIGGFIGRGAGTISNCYIKNSSVVNTGNFSEWGTGAFAGCAWRSAKFTNCYAYNVTVTAKTIPGGFIGKLDDVTVFENCYAGAITITNAKYAGFGHATKSATVTNCYSTLDSVDVTDNLSAVKADKAGIVAGLVTNLADSAYGVSSEINDGFPHLLSFVPDPNQPAVDEDAAALNVPSEVTGAFQVPSVGANGSTITWQSSDEEILSFIGGDATVICGDTDVTVTVVATITKGRVSATRAFEVTIRQKLVAEIAEGELVVTPNGSSRDVALDVTYSGLYEKGYRTITFMAVAVNDKGDILARGMDTATVADSAAAVTETFETTIDSTEGEIKYYLWGDNNVSLIDNTPMDITNLKAKAKTKGIALSWDASFDDSGDAVQYKVYNGNTLLTTTYKTSYMATGSLTEARAFNVVAVDGNGKETPVAVSNAATMMAMYYNNPTSYNAIWKVASNGTPGGDGDSYYVVQEVLVGGVLTKVYVTETSTRDRMIYFARADAIKGSDSIPETERNLTFEVDYLDNSTKPLNFVYNSVIPSGENDSWKYARKAIPIPRVNDGLWKTAVIHVTHAQLRNSGQTGGAEFGVMASKGIPNDETQVREIRMCKTSDYE